MAKALSGQRIVVTGGAGFLGGEVVAELRRRGATDVLAPRSSQYDLTDAGATRGLFAESRPDLVIHLAAKVGGIGANQRKPGTFFRDNMAMGLNVLEEARRAGTPKVVIAGTICAYPKFAPIPFREEDLWNGYPEETNAPYGVAKKSLLVMCQAYRQQYGLNAIYLLPVNLYGPRDNFHLQSSHVIPALIRKCVEARRRGDAQLIAWGTGSPSREFLFVKDCAQGVVAAMEKYDSPEPINLGSGREITIKDLTELIARLSKFSGKIIWDPTKPDGQPRRCLDVSRAQQAIGFTARTSLEDGLSETIEWFESHINAIPERAFSNPAN